MTYEWLVFSSTKRLELTNLKRRKNRDRHPYSAPVLPGRAWDKERGTSPGVCHPAGIRQAAAGRMPAWGDRQP